MISEYMKTTCKIGQGAEACKYILLDGLGFKCGKFNVLDKALVDRAWATTEHVAQGDNCEGQENLKSLP